MRSSVVRRQTRRLAFLEQACENDPTNEVSRRALKMCEDLCESDIRALCLPDDASLSECVYDFAAEREKAKAMPVCACCGCRDIMAQYTSCL